MTLLESDFTDESRSDSIDLFSTNDLTEPLQLGNLPPLQLGNLPFPDLPYRVT